MTFHLFAVTFCSRVYILHFFVAHYHGTLQNITEHCRTFWNATEVLWMEALRAVAESYATSQSILEALQIVTEHYGSTMEPLENVTEIAPPGSSHRTDFLLVVIYRPLIGSK